ncbi:HAMP domain-containing protein [Ferroacidibacillus organovorans]|uniref:histidine kinase n=1 Tax=Ferroacidibacillus organovorans TaxID=1765683 RepID=A0A853KEC9_9BACL|nr:HAMP domain-containing protein [Ferroacidibacillus organovorans]KYP79317.1 hypothetical protein AYJ22_04675 [Ferroacidibacillus organovorans]OAG95237.1 hypothetical protein AYW79_00755 [Ferroacidibacillus organovorans]
MSLYKKLMALFLLVMFIVLGSTLGIVYTQSRALMIGQAEQKTVLLIQTINSYLQSGASNFDFETILLHLSQQNQDFKAFDIYKLNGYFYDIASTNPQKIGSVAPKNVERIMTQGKTVTKLSGNDLYVVAPILVNGVTLYSTAVTYSIVRDLSTIDQLLLKYLIIGLLGIGIAALLIGVFARRMLSRPLLLITAAANDIAQGNLAVDLAPFDRRGDEIGMLARTFQTMAGHLEGILSGIIQTSDQLKLAFHTLVAGGDATVRGALHVSDVMDHMEKALTAHRQSADELVTMSRQLLFRVDGVGNQISFHQLEQDVEVWLQGAERMALRVETLSEALRTVRATANGQLAWIQQVNRQTSQLERLSADLQRLTATFAVDIREVDSQDDGSV